jgi:WD40-like Beta Propeller Repeat
VAVDLCPWLGTLHDRNVRYVEPDVGHVCCARTPPAEIAPDYQTGYCLAPGHVACRYYRQELANDSRPARAAAEQVVDDVGPPPERLLSPWQMALWAFVGLLIVGAAFYFGASGLGFLADPQPTAATSAVVRTSPTHVLTPSFTPSPSLTPATSAFSAVRSGSTPTAYPGGKVYSLIPGASEAGWVTSEQEQGNHLGDSFLYAGTFDGAVYHGAIQFDLSRLPRGAPIYYAALQLTGLDAQRLGQEGSWEIRLLAPSAVKDWQRSSYQEIHNAASAWSLSPILSASALQPGAVYTFEFSVEQLRDLEQRLVLEQYTLDLRLDGPLSGPNSLFAWDSGLGVASRGDGPRLIISVGPPPETPLPTLTLPPTDTPTPTQTPEWVVVTSTPTPGSFLTAAAVAARATVWATTTGTATPMSPYMITATPLYIVVTNTPRPANQATVAYFSALATANVVLTGTPTPTPRNMVTATNTPRPTFTPVLIWFDEITAVPRPTPTASPTTPPIPAILHGKILFLSDRLGQTSVIVLDPDAGRLALLTDRWPYDVVLQQESVSPDGRSWAYVKNNDRGVPQVFIYSHTYGTSWQVTTNTGLSYDPVWSPLGDKLAFVSGEAGNDDVYVVGVDGRDQRRLTFNQWEWDKHPSWSPDGRRIVYWSNINSGRRQLWIMNADGSDQHLLLDSPYNDWDPVWVK